MGGASHVGLLVPWYFVTVQNLQSPPKRHSWFYTAWWFGTYNFIVPNSWDHPSNYFLLSPRVGMMIQSDELHHFSEGLKLKPPISRGGIHEIGSSKNKNVTDRIEYPYVHIFPYISIYVHYHIGNMVSIVPIYFQEYVRSPDSHQGNTKQSKDPPEMDEKTQRVGRVWW